MDANSVGGDELYRGTPQHQGDSPPQPGGDVNRLREAETGGSNGKNSPNQENIDLANKMSPNTSGSALQENDTRSNQDTQNIQQVAALTQAERSTGAQAQGNVEQNRIDTGAQTEEHALSHEADTHQSAESAADVQRNQPTFGGALMQGLTGGVAQGLDQAFNRFGQRVGQNVSRQWGITPSQPDISKTTSNAQGGTGSSGGTGTQTQTPQTSNKPPSHQTKAHNTKKPSKHSSHHHKKKKKKKHSRHNRRGCHCTHSNGRCSLAVSPDRNHDGCCDSCGCPVNGGGKRINRRRVKPRKPKKKHHHHAKSRRGRHYTRTFYGPIKP